MLPTGGQLIDMTLPSNKRKYKCFIPDLVSNDTAQTTPRDAPTPAELLKPLEGSCLYRVKSFYLYYYS
jgi:hypothetical protein